MISRWPGRPAEKNKETQVFQNPKFPKFTADTTTTGRPLGQPILNIIINNTN